MSQGKAPSDEYLTEVAQVCMQAYSAYLNVQQAVANHFGIPVSTAAKQIMVARKRGMLPHEKELQLRRKYDKAKHNLEEYVNNLELLLIEVRE